jgi:DHA1 family bicyclomycin/chloramphenicol resistance-like MFS transporter
MAQRYVTAFGNRRFRLVALAIALSFAGLFLYVASVPGFLGRELGLPPTEYAMMFVPIVAGIVLGSLTAERLAGRVAPTRLILAGFSIQLVSGIVNVTFHAMHAAMVPGSLLPLGFYAFGMSLATPGLMLAGLDQFPQMRGLAASCQAFPSPWCCWPVWSRNWPRYSAATRSPWDSCRACCALPLSPRGSSRADLTYGMDSVL